MRKALADVEYDMQLGDELILGYQMKHGLAVDEGTLVLLWPALMLSYSSPLARADAKHKLIAWVRQAAHRARRAELGLKWHKLSGVVSTEAI